MTTIYLIRHGEITQRIPRRYIGQSELDLTPVGREQIEQLGNYLRRYPITRFHCSPLRRCRESCAILSSHFPDAQPEPIDGLQEISLGRWEGLTIDEVKEKYPGSYEERGNDIAGYRPEGGESFYDVQQRAWQSFVTLAESGAAHIAIVAHSGVNKTLLCKLLGMDLKNLFRLEQDYGCLNVIRYEEGLYRLMSLNFCPH